LTRNSLVASKRCRLGTPLRTPTLSCKINNLSTGLRTPFWEREDKLKSRIEGCLSGLLNSERFIRLQQHLPILLAVVAVPAFPQCVGSHAVIGSCTAWQWVSYCSTTYCLGLCRATSRRRSMILCRRRWTAAVDSPPTSPATSLASKPLKAAANRAS